jgi:hypothetical protein
MRRLVGFFSVIAALSTFVLGTGCSSGATGPPEPPEPSSPLFAVWLADAWEITDLSDPARNASSWSYVCDPGVFGVLPPLRCSVFWLSAVQDSFEIGTTIPAHTGGFGSVGVAPRSLNRGSLALFGTRATLTGAGLSHFDDRLPIVWEAMLEGNVLVIEGTGTWDFPGENQLVPARWMVRSRRCPAEWLHGSHGARGSWCNPFKA